MPLASTLSMPHDHIYDHREMENFKNKVRGEIYAEILRLYSKENQEYLEKLATHQPTSKKDINKHEYVITA